MKTYRIETKEVWHVVATYYVHAENEAAARKEVLDRAKYIDSLEFDWNANVVLATITDIEGDE